MSCKTNFDWFPASLCQSYIRYNSISLMQSLGGCWSRTQMHMGEIHQFTGGLCEYLGSLAQGYLLPEDLPSFGNTRTWTENPLLLTSTDWETTSFTLDLTCFFCSKHWHGVSGIPHLVNLVLWGVVNSVHHRQSLWSPVSSWDTFTDSEMMLLLWMKNCDRVRRGDPSSEEVHLPLAQTPSMSCFFFGWTTVK